MVYDKFCLLIINDKVNVLEVRMKWIGDEWFDLINCCNSMMW